MKVLITLLLILGMFTLKVSRSNGEQKIYSLSLICNLIVLFILVNWGWG